MLNLVTSTWEGHHHLLLVLASTTWVLGSLSLFLVLQRSLEFGWRRRRQWSAISAVTGGIGVWATHFLAMLAYHHDNAMQFDALPTASSIVVVIVLFWIALRPLSQNRDIYSAMYAGLFTSIGVGLMHFIGMTAMQSVSVHYDPGPIFVSSGLSFLLFSSAFLIFLRCSGWCQVVLPTITAIFSVLLLHFGAMAATTIVMDHRTVMLPGLDRAWLVAAIFAATMLLLLGTATAFIIDRYLTDLRGLANATMEGLAIVHGERIIEANSRFAALLNADPRLLVGSNPRDWLSPNDGLPLLVERSAPLEATMTHDGAVGRVFEAATHNIEYRGRDCVALALRDMTKERAAQRQIEHMARHDPLTDLPNRALLDERIAHGIALADRSGQSLALIALDLDRFKAVNDFFGHAAGDQVLCEVATILTKVVRETDTVARIGGDEFVILQVGASQPHGAQALTDRIFDAFSRDMDVSSNPTAVGISIGVAVYPEDAGTIASLRHHADIALYRAKAAGRGVASFFDKLVDV